MQRRTLTIIDTHSELREIDLETYGKPLVQLGRSREQCEVVISDNIVSKIQGTIWLEGTKTFYRDQNSRNGTYFGNAHNSRLLNKNDGYVELYDKSVLRIGNMNNPDEMVLLLYRNSKEEEGWRKQELKGSIVRIGRSRENDIALNNPGVSKEHCLIYCQNGKMILKDLESMNGVLVNGCIVRGQQILHDKDLIQILDFQLLFSNNCIYYRTATSGVSLRVCNINKIVGRGTKKKKILRDVSCEINANEFVAIIGGSGAGKTTLMNAISGFEKEFSGNVYCNGVDLIEQFQSLKSIIGFVPQQDIIYENLTLKRMLIYTAKLKMPSDTQKFERDQRIQEVLEMVDLVEHQNTFIRKLSGGQKKRASIAVELLADPKLFFLDEPTSGLDPGTEKNLMITLNKLSKTKNKTIIMVTHTTQNLHLCDKVIFMGPGGRLCFCGNVQAAKEFFETEDLVNIYNIISDNPEYWQKKYSRNNERDNVYQNHSEKKENDKLEKNKKTSALRQFGILTERYAELLFNDRPRLILLLVQPFLIAILLNIVADKNIFKIYESTKSMLFALSCSGIWIGMFNSIQEICKERVILKREYMANLRLSCYMLSKFVLQALLGLLQAVILTLVFLKLTGKHREGIFVSQFELEILFTIWLTIMASVAMGFVISAMVKSGDKAMAAAPFVLIVQLLFSGILFSLKGIGKKISYCTVSRWSVEALGSIARLNRLDLKMQEEFPMLEHKAESFFKASAGHVAKTWFILFGMTVLVMAVGTILLRRVAKDHR